MKRFIPFLKSTPKVAVVRLSGVIAAGSRGSLSDTSMASVIERAFSKGKPKAVALVINSPGGSPVQSSLIAARIRRLSKEKDIPVTAFVEDVAASGGYWLATAADEIIVDESSIVGSIGVISASFGFDKLIAKHGIERRVHTAGKSKTMLDPFQPEKPADVKRLKALQEQIHQSFIAQVTSRRGDKLATGRDLFTGEIWVGQSAIDDGIADQIGHLVPVMQERYGEDVKFIKYGPKRSILQRFGAQIMGEAMASVEERTEYARFGL